MTGRAGGQRTSWPAARAAAHTAVRPLAARPVPLGAAGGGRLAGDVVAGADVPAFDRSAMDGYAVRGGPPWTVRGEVSLRDPAMALGDGEACAVVTGAALAPGTTGVLRIEHAELHDGLVHGEIRFGENIRRRGEECCAGDVVLRAGALVTPIVQGFAASLGLDELVVRPRPVITGLVTGDELVTAGRPGVGVHRDAIGPMLPGLAATVGADLTGPPVLVSDRPGALETAITSATGDLVVVTGASSVGRSDQLRAALVSIGGRFVIDGVDCRPGHPMAMAVVDGRPVVGLPGNPLAALAAFWTLAAPALTGLRGDPLGDLPRLPFSGITASAAGTVLVPAVIDSGLASTVSYRGSGMLRGAAVADALAVITAGDTDAAIIPLRPSASWQPDATEGPFTKQATTTSRGD